MNIELLKETANTIQYEAVLDGAIGCGENFVILGIATSLYAGKCFALASCTEFLQAPIPAELTKSQLQAWRQLSHKAEAKAAEGKDWFALGAISAQRKGGRWVEEWVDYTNGLFQAVVSPAEENPLAKEVGDAPF